MTETVYNRNGIPFDIDNIATDLNYKADLDGSNMATSVKNFDGQWVQSISNVCSNVSAPTSTNISLSLSTYLPNDSYNYEVLIMGIGVTGATSGNQQRIIVYSDIISNEPLWWAITRTSATSTGAGSCILPVGTGRSIVVAANSSNTGTFSLSLCAYRRIGTNQ